MGLFLSEAITNALKHAGGADIRVVLRMRGNDLLLEVADNGPGLPPNCDQRSSGGFRLMRSLASRLNGRVDLQGTMVLVVHSTWHSADTRSLGTRRKYWTGEQPRCSGSVGPEGLCAPDAPMKRCVLIVDDEPLILELLADRLKEMNYDVWTAHNGAEGLQVLARNPHIAVLLSDVNMPGMSGHELAERARRLREGLQVLLLSGREGDGHGYPIVRKPFVRHELVIWNPSSSHYRRALRASKGERLWRMQG